MAPDGAGQQLPVVSTANAARLLAQGEVRQCKAVLETLLHSAPDNVQALCQLSHCSLLLGAEPELEEAIASARYKKVFCC